MPVSRLTAEGLAADVAAVYARAEVRLLQLIARHLAAGKDTPAWAESKLAELQLIRRRTEQEVARANREAVTLLRGTTETAYLRGAAAGEGELGALGVDTEDLTPRHASPAVRALVRAQAEALEQMGPQILRTTLDAYRDAVARATGGSLTGAATRLEDAQRALDDLAGRGITGFVDKAGRQWSLQSYVEMATRTTTSQAAITGHMDRLQDAGIELFIVSDSPRECPRCQPWEGKVLSRGPVAALQRNALTGEMEAVRVDGTVNDAMNGGLFHPNCTHNLSGYIHGATTRTANANPSGYVERQEMRRMERGIREWKRREAVALTPEAQTRARAKVREWQGRAREHAAATGLRVKPNRQSLAAAR